VVAEEEKVYVPSFVITSEQVVAEDARKRVLRVVARGKVWYG
jgi:hypothetical protein